MEGARLDPVEAFKKTLCSYLESRGEMLFSLTSLSGQKLVRIVLLAFYRRHDPGVTGYQRFDHVLAAIRDCGEECWRRLAALGVEGFEQGGGEDYIVFSVEKLRELAQQCRS